MNSESQFGEIDQLGRHIINRAVADQRVVVDVGARGRERSNSRDFLHFLKWKAVLVEANPALADQIRQEFAGLDFQLISCAVSNYEGEADLTIGINDDVSSITAANAAKWGDTRGSVRVPVRRLPEILDEYNVPKNFGLLSLDIEGEDVRVLNDLIGCSAYRPLYIIIEASYNFATKSLADLQLVPLARQAYRIVGQTIANLILERVESGDTVEALQEALSEHSAYVARLEQDLSAARQTNAALLASFSWRISLPVRVTGNLARLLLRKGRK